jgi:hypothetical protein
LIVVPGLGLSGIAASANAQTNTPSTHFRRGVPDRNETMVVNQVIPAPLPWNVSSPFVPTFSLTHRNSTTDPQTPCSNNEGNFLTSSCGSVYQAAYGYYECVSNACPNHYDNSNFAGTIYYVKASVSFKGTSPSSALTSGNWMSGGLSVTEPVTTGTCGTGCNGMDLSYSTTITLPTLAAWELRGTS